jgi:hypothetical protein
MLPAPSHIRLQVRVAWEGVTTRVGLTMQFEKSTNPTAMTIAETNIASNEQTVHSARVVSEATTATDGGSSLTSSRSHHGSTSGKSGSFGSRSSTPKHSIPGDPSM